MGYNPFGVQTQTPLCVANLATGECLPSKIFRTENHFFSKDQLDYACLGMSGFFLLGNQIYHKKEVMGLPTVQLRPNESQEQLLRRFRKKVAKSGVLSTLRKKRWFVSKSELRRIQKKKAIRRSKRRSFGKKKAF